MSWLKEDQNAVACPARHDTIPIDRGGSHAETSPSGLHTVRTDGCGLQHHYYRVTDPGSGKTYYTNKFERVWQGGAVNFEDAQSGISVTLQSSEVKELSEGEFMATLAVDRPSWPTVEATSNV